MSDLKTIRIKSKEELEKIIGYSLGSTGWQDKFKHGWNSDMEKYLGKVYEEVSIDDDGDISTTHGSHPELRWTWYRDFFDIIDQIEKVPEFTSDLLDITLRIVVSCETREQYINLMRWVSKNGEDFASETQGWDTYRSQVGVHVSGVTYAPVEHYVSNYSDTIVIKYKDALAENYRGIEYYKDAVSSAYRVPKGYLYGVDSAPDGESLSVAIQRDPRYVDVPLKVGVGEEETFSIEAKRKLAFG